MDKDPNLPSISSEKSDYVASAAKAALGAIPFVGSLLAEVAGTVIPNQRIDRISQFAQDLSDRLKKLEESFVRSQISDENFTDLLEEGIRQAARSLSPERRKYIAALIANSLSSDKIQFAESKHLLRILGELNDVEIIWLRFFLVPTLGGDEEFRALHRDVLRPVMATMGAPQEVHDKEALQNSYKEHLTQLGLLRPLYRVDGKSKQLEVDSRGQIKLQRHELTRLGKMLLRETGLEINEGAG